jgi:hypothetical protein
MLIEQNGGIVLLSAPAMNAKKSDDNHIITIIPWNTNLTAIERLQYGTDAGRQVWYKVTHNGKEGWIPALFQSVPYIVGGDCVGNTLISPSTLTFKYDRYTAALYTLMQGQANNFRTDVSQKLSTKLILTPTPPGSPSVDYPPYAAFLYKSILNPYNNGATGSGAFLSEALWAGGLPFVHGNDGNRNPPCYYNEVSGGWKYCVFDDRVLAAASWITEPGQLRQFTSLDSVTATQLRAYSTNIEVQNTWMPANSKGGLIRKIRVGPDELLGPGGSGGGEDISSYFNDITDPELTLQGNKTDSFSLWVSSNLNSIKAGDYVFINATLNVGGHALLVVGWGPMVNCSVSYNDKVYKSYTLLSNPLGSPPDDSTLSQNYPGSAKINGFYYVPYVADYSGLGDQAPQTLPHQQNTGGRPFYCTQADTPNRFGSSNASGKHYWYFIAMPNQVTVKPPSSAALDRLYAPPYWNWNSAGVIVNQQATPITYP